MGQSQEARSFKPQTQVNNDVIRLDITAGRRETRYKKRSLFDYQNYIIAPNSRFKFWWKVVIAFILLYMLLIFPYRFAFDDHRKGYLITDGLIDLVFLSDFIFHFFYSFIDKRQRQVVNFKPILMKYVFGTMVFDIIALYPYYFGSDSSIYVLKIFRYARLADMLSGITMCLDELFLKIKNNMNFALSITRIIK